MVMQVLLILYGVILLVGGWIGYRQAGSHKSLVSGVISGVVIFGAVGLSFWRMDWGLGLGLVTAVLLAGVFVGRWRATGKVMPAGIMVGLSGAVAVMAGMTLLAG